MLKVDTKNCLFGGEFHCFRGRNLTADKALMLEFVLKKDAKVYLILFYSNSGGSGF